jgi:hypothetical protein
MSKRDPYLLVVAALWLSIPLTALHFWSAWDQLPVRMATHFDDQWRANGWSSRDDALWLAFVILGLPLVIVTPACLWVRARKPSQAWPVLVIATIAVVLIAWAANSIVSRNLSSAFRAPRSVTGGQSEGGFRCAHGRAFSSAAASRKSVASSPKRDANCVPMGKPCAFQKRGTLIAGCPVWLKSWVLGV